MKVFKALDLYNSGFLDFLLLFLKETVMNAVLEVDKKNWKITGVLFSWGDF